jgi:hypothetical protein
LLISKYGSISFSPLIVYRFDVAGRPFTLKLP